MSSGARRPPTLSPTLTRFRQLATSPRNKSRHQIRQSEPAVSTFLGCHRQPDALLLYPPLFWGFAGAFAAPTPVDTSVNNTTCRQQNHIIFMETEITCHLY